MGDDKGSGLAEVLSDNSERILVGVLAVAVLAAVVVGGFYVVFFREAPVSGDPASWGQLGDYLGGVLNPVFGFLSVFALLVALVLQTRELKLSRESLKLSQEELRLSREEQAKAAEALGLQNRAIQKQSFEQTFFAMLGLLEEVVSGYVMRIPNLLARAGGVASSTSNFEGRRAMGRQLLGFEQEHNRDLPVEQYQEQLKKRVAHISSNEETDNLVRYARTLVTILDYLKHSGIGPDEIYPKILRGQLSGVELKLIYLLCFDPRWESLKATIEYYRLLAFLNIQSTGIGANYSSFFAASAFQE
jgi:hypothetical protein